eukprot:CAMPEP_0197240838 /NCGR_PEP_ID=MMETSP1429-20130617/7042_1 /TAXON_ID=49237 /ORGANISM="Chaetoceros  sp., Strain UNC1202" /LENGTH=247 /DNA_ID=CAMNT_0042700563 /DNA_START=1 /DNA_END=744 /DNA_ORIENTATION=+
MTSIAAAPKDDQKKIRFYQMAASSQSGQQLEFTSSGSTGDHVGGGFDGWLMKKVPYDPTSSNKDEKVTVNSVRIDDIIHNKIGPTDVFGVEKDSLVPIDRLFFLKVDVQGFEPHVFSGLTDAIREKKMDFILMEFWPKGMDLVNDAEEKCILGANILQQLYDSGYKLFSMGTVSHPKSPKAAQLYGKTVIPRSDDPLAFCKFYYEIEEKNPSDEYHMGYWTDVFAMSPDARLPEIPVSGLGQFLLKF